MKKVYYSVSVHPQPCNTAYSKPRAQHVHTGIVSWAKVLYVFYLSRNETPVFHIHGIKCNLLLHGTNACLSNSFPSFLRLHDHYMRNKVPLQLFSLYHSGLLQNKNPTDGRSFIYRRGCAHYTYYMRTMPAPARQTETVMTKYLFAGYVVIPCPPTYLSAMRERAKDA